MNQFYHYLILELVLEIKSSDAYSKQKDYHPLIGRVVFRTRNPAPMFALFKKDPRAFDYIVKKLSQVK